MARAASDLDRELAEAWARRLRGSLQAAIQTGEVSDPAGAELLVDAELDRLRDEVTSDPGRLGEWARARGLALAIRNEVEDMLAAPRAAAAPGVARTKPAPSRSQARRAAARLEVAGMSPQRLVLRALSTDPALVAAALEEARARPVALPAEVLRWAQALPRRGRDLAARAAAVRMATELLVGQGLPATPAREEARPDPAPSPAVAGRAGATGAAWVPVLKLAAAADGSRPRTLDAIDALAAAPGRAPEALLRQLARDRDPRIQARADAALRRRLGARSANQ